MPLKHRIAATIFGLEVALLLAVAVTFIVQARVYVARQADLTESIYLEHLSTLSRVALLTEDYGELQVFVDEAVDDPIVDAVVVVDVFGTVVASTLPLLLGAPFDGFSSLGLREHAQELVVRGYGQELGVVHARVTREPLFTVMRDVMLQTLLVALVSIVVSAAVAFALGSWLAKRLAALAQASATVAAGGPFQLPDLDGASPEVKRLAFSIETMVSRLREHAEDLRRARDRLIVPTEAMGQGFALWDEQDRLQLCNGRLAEILGIAPERLIRGLNLSALAADVLGDAASTSQVAHICDQRGLARGVGAASFELALVGDRRVQVEEAVTRDGGIVGLYTDITERRRHERRLDLVMSCVLDGLLIVDHAGRVLQANPAAERMFGASAEELATTSLAKLLRTTRAWDELLTSPATGSHLIEGEAAQVEGSLLPVEIAVVHAGEDEPGLFIVGLRDIRVRKQAEAELRFAALHDPLTGVLNHSEMQARVDAAVISAQENGRSVSFLFIDLDGFKLINDTRGHAVGDALLVEVARRLAIAVGDRGVIGRLGGDEFGVLLKELGGIRRSALVADRVLNAFKAPAVVDGESIEIGTSIGIAIYPDHASSGGELLRAADLALYQAKREGGLRWRLFRRHEAARLRHRVAVAQRLAHALERGELHLAYQPQYALATGELSGFEALLRWTSGMFGPMPPDAFIPIAEETGRISEVGYWVLEKAVADLKQLEAVSTSSLRIAVNVSPRQLADPDFADRTLSIVGDRIGALALELTERVLMDGVGRTQRQLDRLSAAGLPLVLDDFGTGYSSLNHLRRFRISEVKIDRSFVADILVDPNDAHLVRALINLCRDLGIVATAEGVETSPQLEWLRQAGCTFGQGFLFARPMPLHDALRSVQAQGAAPRVDRAVG